MIGYDTLQAEDGTVCFGCYDTDKKEIYVAGDIPVEALFHTIAHEYKHFLQDVNGEEYDEKQADEFADAIIK